ncbi:hypothetical protein FJT64_002831 [Amphibalanus amphitrite]|uniref:Uncharacterized protein n=1 Tax=Amphibalanus amphitrite TaxID=1232801 RepID=A0A6A4WFR0_AMPAM|nr:hypothetical protein FJT64_002831 [Amphibalanus amphitrite]
MPPHPRAAGAHPCPHPCLSIRAGRPARQTVRPNTDTAEVLHGLAFQRIQKCRAPCILQDQKENRKLGLDRRSQNPSERRTQRTLQNQQSRRRQRRTCSSHRRPPPTLLPERPATTRRPHRSRDPTRRWGAIR